MIPKVKHPITTLTVPSNGKKISVRPMLVKEEKLLLMAKERKQVGEVLAAIKQVVGNCIIDKNFDIDKISIFDLEYLFLQLRAISVSNVVKVSYEDPEDNKTYDFDIDLQKIEVIMPKDSNNKINLGENTWAYMKWPEASTYTDTSILELEPTQIQDEMTFRHIDKIVVSEGSKEKVWNATASNYDEIEEFMNDLPLNAYAEIQKFINNAPVMKHVIKYKNSKGTEREIVLSSLTDFFTFV